MSRHCKCEKWQEVNWTSEHNFLFCPYCGVRLIAPCHICGTPSNEHTGNTLYWYEDKDFCSAACSLDFGEALRRVKKLDMSFAEKEIK